MGTVPSAGSLAGQFTSRPPQSSGASHRSPTPTAPRQCPTGPRRCCGYPNTQGCPSTMPSSTTSRSCPCPHPVTNVNGRIGGSPHPLCARFAPLRLRRRIDTPRTAAVSGGAARANGIVTVPITRPRCSTRWRMPGERGAYVTPTLTNLSGVPASWRLQRSASRPRLSEPELVGSIPGVGRHGDPGAARLACALFRFGLVVDQLHAPPHIGREGTTSHGEGALASMRWTMPKLARGYARSSSFTRPSCRATSHLWAAVPMDGIPTKARTARCQIGCQSQGSE